VKTTKEPVILNRVEFDNSPRNLAIKDRFLGHYYFNPKLTEFRIIEFSPSRDYVKIVALNDGHSEVGWKLTQEIIVDERLENKGD